MYRVNNTIPLNNTLASLPLHSFVKIRSFQILFIYSNSISSYSQSLLTILKVNMSSILFHLIYMNVHDMIDNKVIFSISPTAVCDSLERYVTDGHTNWGCNCLNDTCHYWSALLDIYYFDHFYQTPYVNKYNFD